MNPFAIAKQVQPVCDCLTAARGPNGNAVVKLLRSWILKFGIHRASVLARMAVACCSANRR